MRVCKGEKRWIFVCVLYSSVLHRRSAFSVQFTTRGSRMLIVGGLVRAIEKLRASSERAQKFAGKEFEVKEVHGVGFARCAHESNKQPPN